MPLGTEVGLGLGDIVLDGDPALSPKDAQPPIFGLEKKSTAPTQYLVHGFVTKRLDG